MPRQRLREIILDKAAQKELDTAEIIKGSGMPESYLEAILEHDSEKVPAFPYIRNHLISLAEFLELDPQEVLASYKEDFAEKISGVHDKLPSNRYSLPSKKKRIIYALATVAVVAFLYFLLQSLFNKGPEIEIAFPPANPTPTIVKTESIMLKGQVAPEDKLIINGQTVPVESSGSFSHEYLLTPGTNYLEFRIERLLADDIIVTREVYFEQNDTQPAANASSTSESASSSPAEASSTDELLQETKL